MFTRRSIALCVVILGVALEHFDMMLVNLFATSLAGHFISASSAEQTVMLGFVGYAISFIFRPAGAALFGIVGDTLGRKPSMLLSILLMSVATLGIGLIPPFAEIGVIATLLFVGFRILQGLSVGGEYGAAMTYSYEIANHKKTLAGALVISATHIGGLAASLVAISYSQNFQTAFRFAGVLGLLSLLMRSLLVESRPREAPKRPLLLPVLQSLFAGRREYARAFLIASNLVFTFYASLVYLNEVIFQRGLAERAEIFRSNALMLSVWVVFPPIAGYLVDRFGYPYRRVMAVGATLVAISIAPLLSLASQLNTLPAWIGVQLGLSVLHGSYCFATPRYLGELFPSEIRNTGVALGYSLGASFTAALTPLICHALVTITGRIEAIALPIIALSTFTVSKLIREQLSEEKVR